MGRMRGVLMRLYAFAIFVLVVGLILLTLLPALLMLEHVTP